jgi:CRP-like cAMP-binding protein
MVWVHLNYPADALTEEELALISADSEYRYHDIGHVLLAEGAVSDAFYVIVGGLVDSVVRLPDGSRKIVETLGPGKYFGMTSMLTPDPSFLEFVAKTDVTLIRIDLDCVRRIISARPELAGKLAASIKDRLDSADAARVQSRQPAPKLTLRDIRKGIERRLRTARRSGRQVKNE